MTAARNLDEWLAWQAQCHSKAWDLGLARIASVWQALGGGRIARHIVTVAGTNGKGSCVCWCEALAVAHGVSVASFTSPHLRHYRERIRFDGHWVEETALLDAFYAIDAARGETTLTYFEWAALAAFYLMRARMPEVAVLEVGLGGRLDATNIIDADAAIITRIGLDHQQWLGNDIECIGAEKAGILRHGQTLALSDAHPPQSILERADALSVITWQQGRELSAVREGEYLNVSVPNFAATLPLPVLMSGTHQYGQFAACLAIMGQWVTLDVEKVAQVAVRTSNPGRLMWMPVVGHDADWLVDVAHNGDSAEVLAAFIAKRVAGYRRVWCICSMLADKAHASVLSALEGIVNHWIFCGLDVPRGCSAGALANVAQDVGIVPTAWTLADTPKQAFDFAASQTGKGDLVVVMGSFVTVSEVLKEVENNE